MAVSPFEARLCAVALLVVGLSWPRPAEPRTGFAERSGARLLAAMAVTGNYQIMGVI